MKSKLSLLSSLLLLTLVFTACQKSDKPADDGSTATQLAVQSDDQASFSAAIDAVADDASLALETSGGSMAGRPTEILDLVCNAAVAIDTTTSTRTITITYSGADCLGIHTRTGVVVVSAAPGVRWKNAGAVLTVNYQNLKVTRVSDNKSITINGQQTFTNISGGLLFNLATLGSITHGISSNGLTVKFDDNTQRIWKVAKQRVFSYNNGIVISTSGTHTEGGVSNIAEWGTNRFGGIFTSATLQPVVIRQDCAFRITSGAVQHTTAGITATATFGLNQAGNETSCPGTGNYYCKISWTGPNGNTGSVIVPY